MRPGIIDARARYRAEARRLRNAGLERLSKITQGVPGGNVNFLGDHSVGHSKQKCICTRVIFRKVSVIEPFRCTGVWIWRPILSSTPAVLRHCMKRQLALVTADSDTVGVLCKMPHLFTNAEYAGVLYV